MTKTPYEIRFELLNFAYNQLQSEYHCAMDKIRTQKEFNIPIDPLPKFPTKDEVVKLAEELKQFIDNK